MTAAESFGSVQKNTEYAHATCDPHVSWTGFIYFLKLKRSCPLGEGWYRSPLGVHNVDRQSRSTEKKVERDLTCTLTLQAPGARADVLI